MGSCTAWLQSCAVQAACIATLAGLRQGSWTSLNKRMPHSIKNNGLVSVKALPIMSHWLHGTLLPVFFYFAYNWYSLAVSCWFYFFLWILKKECCHRRGVGETGRSHGDDVQPVNYLSLLTFCAGTAPHAAVPCLPPAWLHTAICQTLVFQCEAQNLSVNTIRTGSLTEGAWQIHRQNNQSHFLRLVQSTNTEREGCVYSVSGMTNDMTQW